MVDQIKPVIRDKPDLIIFPVETNDFQSDENSGDTAKLIVDLAMSAKSPACDISLSNIITTKDKRQNKAQEVNNHLKEMYTNKIINLIVHSKNMIKYQYLNTSKLHLINRVTKHIINNIRTRNIQKKFNDNAFYVALMKKFLVIAVSLNINLIAKIYALKLTI